MNSLRWVTRWVRAGHKTATASGDDGRHVMIMTLFDAFGDFCAMESRAGRAPYPIASAFARNTSRFAGAVFMIVPSAVAVSAFLSRFMATPTCRALANLTSASLLSLDPPTTKSAPTMLEQRIQELEQQLAAANETVATLTRQNAELTGRISDAETRNKKLKRSARRDESSFKEQLAVAQSKRG